MRFLGLLVLCLPSTALAETLYVGGAGDPHATIDSALGAAVDGDVVIVRDGSYAESLATQADGVTVRGEGNVVISSPSRVLRISHARFTLENVTLDGMFGDADAVVIDDSGNEATLRRVEVRNARRDCIDIRGPSGVRIEGSLVHHCLNSTAADCNADACRADAHGIVAGPVRDLTITDTEVHTFSGDAFQVDPGRSDPGWNDVVIERCHFWLEPLPAAIGGFAAGVVPGENAIDTKTSDTIVEPGRLTIRDTIAHGFGGGLISNMAAYNLKENVEATLDRITIYDSEIAFRLRGATSERPRGAQVTIHNTVVFRVETAIRYEDDIEPVTLYNSTFGADIARAFNDQSTGSTIDARNLLVLGSALPDEAMGGASNLAVAADAFVDAAGDDYHLPMGSPAIDAGETLAEVNWDRDLVPRPVGASHDVGAYELCASADCAPPDAGVVPGRDAGPRIPGEDAGTPAGTDAGPGSDGGGPAGPDDDGGCGCRTPGQGGSPGLFFLVLLAAIFAAGRKRRL
jgi:MYXO-CTERM domain-containing protein